MAAVFFSLLVLSVSIWCGWLAARCTLPDAPLSVTVPLGCGYGVSLLAAVPGLFALCFGFRLPAILLSSAFMLGGGLLLYHKWYPQSPSPPDSDDAFLVCLLPLLAVTGVLLYTHILRPAGGDFHTGQSCYGDMAMHLGFIKNIALTGKFPPNYPLLGGEHRFGYPFLCETVSSVFLVLGADLRTAYLLPMVPAFLSVYGMAWNLARRVLGSAVKASLAFWLFFLGSGLGFLYFLDGSSAFASIFTGFYTTPTNFVQKNIVWVNPVVDLLIPQRATLFGWSVLFPALYLFWRFCFEEQGGLWLSLSVLVLPLPLLHTHSALALVLICAVGGIYTLIFRPRTCSVLLPWLGLAGLCGLIWLPEMWNTVFAQSLDGQHMIRLHFNWINGREDGTLNDPYFVFYLKNIGLTYLVLLPSFLHAGRRQRWFYGGGLLILLLSEFVVFQPNLYDNNKLLFIWHLLGCLLAANFWIDLSAKIRSPAWRVLFLSVICVISMFGSVLTLGRELLSDYRQWSADDAALADYVDQNAEPDALFLTSDSHLTPVFSLAGRQILCGSGSFVYYHGMNYASEANAQRTLYEAPDETVLYAWGIDYVVFDASVYASFQAQEYWYADRYELWYQNESARIYKIS